MKDAEAPMKYTCAGCSQEIPQGEVFPQETGKYREFYCRPCNKKYGLFLERRPIVLMEVDKLRANLIKKLKAEVFGKPDLGNAPAHSPRPVVDADGKPMTNEAVASMRMNLSAGGQVVGEGEGFSGLYEGEAEPDIEAEARRKGKVKKA